MISPGLGVYLLLHLLETWIDGEDGGTASKRLLDRGIQLSPLLRKCLYGHPREGFGGANDSGRSTELDVPMEGTKIGSDRRPGSG